MTYAPQMVGDGGAQEPVTSTTAIPMGGGVVFADHGVVITSGSWLNLVEVWFGIIERQAIHRGSFASVTDLNRRIRTFIDGWNDRCHPFVRTKTTEQILAKANRQKTSDAAH
jgi:hypothetical protein